MVWKTFPYSFYVFRMNKFITTKPRMNIVHKRTKSFVNKTREILVSKIRMFDVYKKKYTLTYSKNLNYAIFSRKL